MPSILLPNDEGSFVVAATGPRGSGKSLLLAALACQVMVVRRQKVYSNMQIVWDCDKNGAVPGGPRKGKWETQPLDKDALLAFDSEDMAGAWIIWDEIQNDVDSRRPMSLGNILHSKVMAQIRKRDMSLAYSVQDMAMVDTRLRWQTDLEFACTDLFVRGFIESDERPSQRGVLIGFARRNVSGYLPGQIYSQTGYQRLGKFYGKRFWNCYSTKEVQNPLEAMVPYKLALGQKVISVGEPEQKVDQGALLTEYVEGLRARGMTRMGVDDFWKGANEAGITARPTTLSSTLRQLVRWKRSAGLSNSYELLGGANVEPVGATNG